MINYEEQNFNLRINEAKRMLEKYSTRIPVIVNCGKDLTIVKRKYLVPFDITCGQFLYVLRFFSYFLLFMFYICSPGTPS